MKKLTIQILTWNNEATLERCLRSVLVLPNTKIQVIDLGSSDKTIELCQNLGIHPLSHKYEERHKIRRLYLSEASNWKMYLHPWEHLSKGQKEIENIIETNEEMAFYCRLVTNTIISKEIRLWNKKLDFKNPVFENLKDNSALHSREITFHGTQRTINPKEIALISQWKKQEPLNVDPYYYEALTALLQYRFAEFIPLAENYLNIQKIGIAPTMMRYYLAMMQLYYKRYQNALENILKCIAVNPALSEFWCLLGDIQYQTGHIAKARAFYENAIILKNRRKSTTLWPLDVAKLKDYPTTMIQRCDKILGA